jgi:hypothetical protein
LVGKMLDGGIPHPSLFIADKSILTSIRPDPEGYRPDG